MRTAAVTPRQPRYPLLLLPAAGLLAPFYVALVIIAGVSLVDYPGIRTGTFVITAANYQAALLDSFHLAVLIRTIVIGLVVGVLSAVMATPMAFAIVRTRRRSVRVLLTLFTIIPFLVNALVRVFAWTTVLGREGFLNYSLIGLGLVETPTSFLRTDVAVVIGQLYFVLPFAIIAITALMSKLSENIEHAASILGATPWQTFFRITLPLLMPAIFSAGLLAYALSVSAFVVPLVLGGDQYKMYSNLIYDQITFSGDYGLAAAMAVVLLVVSVVLAQGARLFLTTATGR